MPGIPDLYGGGLPLRAMGRTRDYYRQASAAVYTPAGRGYLMLAVMSAAFGFAMNAHNSIVTNYFNDVLGFSEPQFGYITAIREVGGFVLIFLSALLYRVSLQRVTAGALIVLAIGYGFFGMADSFATVIPWVVITSLGFHMVLQTQASLGMSLTTQDKSGHILGRMGAFTQAGTLAAYVMIFLLFHFANKAPYNLTFIILGVVAFLGALAILRFPHLHEGELREVAPKRQPIVFKREYRYYYLLNLFDGARQQIFFSFGLMVLVRQFGYTVTHMSLLFMGVTFAATLTASRLGRWVDRRGERRTLSIVNLWYVFALAGFALAGNVWVATLFYIIYILITPLSFIGGATYLRKVAVYEDVASSLAMGVTILHATAIVVPVAAGYILNYTGYQIPFYIACGFALVNFAVTLRLDPVKQRCAAKIAADEAAAEKAATAAALQRATAAPSAE
jgi:MFS family permease